MAVLRLIVAVLCLMGPAKSAPIARKEKISDVDQAIMADAQALYESLELEYEAIGCVKVLGEFPKSSSATKLPIGDQDRKGPMPCRCGSIFDTATLALFDDADDERAAKGRETILFAAERSENSGEGTRMTHMDAWRIARTSNSFEECDETVGLAGGVYPCSNIDLLAHLPLTEMILPAEEQQTFPRGFGRRDASEASDLWGWTDDETGREFVILATRQGIFFVEATTSDDLVVVGYLRPPSITGNIYNNVIDVKVIGNFAYIGMEQANAGIQIFNLTRLVDFNPDNECDSPGYCKRFSADNEYKGTEDFGVTNSHNLVANEESEFLYVVGIGEFGNDRTNDFKDNDDKDCRGGLHVVNVSDPFNPTFAGCFSDAGYIHDAQCVNYQGPDTNYAGSEICFCFNEDVIAIVDVTDKTDMEIISTFEYENFEYTHQGWLSVDQTHLVFTDEYDEIENTNVINTRTMVINVENLAEPTNFQEYFGPTRAVDHNLYIVPAANPVGPGRRNLEISTLENSTDLIYQSNWQKGFTILQVIDYEQGDFVEVGTFDTYPENDDSLLLGAWSSYAFFESGRVPVSDTMGGLYLLNPRVELIDPNARSTKGQKKGKNQKKGKGGKKQKKNKGSSPSSSSSSSEEAATLTKSDKGDKSGKSEKSSKSDKSAKS